MALLDQPSSPPSHTWYGVAWSWLQKFLLRNHNLFAPGAGRNTLFFTNHRAQYSHKHQLSDLHHLNCFNMSIKRAPPAERYYKHTSLDVLVKQINEHVKSEEYAVTRKRSSVNDWTTINGGTRIEKSFKRSKSSSSRWLKRWTTKRRNTKYFEDHDECFPSVTR